MAVLDAGQVAGIPSFARVLELGCGQIRRVPNSVTIDVNPRSIADVIHDLNVTPYPFPDNEFDIVVAEHVLEHLDDVLKIMEELHRILKPGGLLYVEVPHFSSCNTFTDPTHRHAFSSKSFDYFVPGEPLHEFRYSTVTFRRLRVMVSPFERCHRIRRMLHGWTSRNLGKYEQNYAFLCPSERINFELKAIK